MRHRLLVILLLVTATLMIAPGTACACSCAPLEPAEQVKESAAVFTGTMTAARKLDGDPLGPTPPVVYTFRADQVYKGKASAEFEVATNADEAACGYRFTAGSRYLVFASAGESGLFAVDPGVALHTSLCAGNRMVRPGGAPLRTEDGTQNGEPLTAELLTALGTATRPPVTVATPSSGASGGEPTPHWIYLGVAGVSLAVAFASRRLSGRGKA
ncbi:hypothetical protein [Streptosporangium lutulentum]|uniref:Tissue inhibitor of metalloproteinase n=1 Tax=Streptosporangium lutulentum TaxID=1461250 RepID=A0ABT9Q5V7_9ACTN|nr:hypothetical protein [Streptosporangium lutulentum]MDP9842047.1 hypothetical protein [Streptosporangium lutulentum]